MYLVEDDKKKYGVRNSGGPRQDIRSRRKEDGDQTQNRADKFDIAHRTVKDREERFLDVKERVKTGRIGHVIIEIYVLGNES